MSQLRIQKGTQRVGDVEVATAVVVETPELDKMQAVQDESQAIGSFLDYGGYTLCEFDDVSERYVPVRKSIEEILAEYFEIDLKKVDDERRAILEGIRR